MRSAIFALVCCMLIAVHGSGLCVPQGELACGKSGLPLCDRPTPILSGVVDARGHFPGFSRAALIPNASAPFTCYNGRLSGCRECLDPTDSSPCDGDGDYRGSSHCSNRYCGSGGRCYCARVTYNSSQTQFLADGAILPTGTVRVGLRPAPDFNPSLNALFPSLFAPPPSPNGTAARRLLSANLTDSFQLSITMENVRVYWFPGPVALPFSLVVEVIGANGELAAPFSRIQLPLVHTQVEYPLVGSLLRASGIVRASVLDPIGVVRASATIEVIRPADVFIPAWLDMINTPSRSLRTFPEWPWYKQLAPLTVLALLVVLFAFLLRCLVGLLLFCSRCKSAFSLRRSRPTADDDAFPLMGPRPRPLRSTLPFVLFSLCVGLLPSASAIGVFIPVTTRTCMKDGTSCALHMSAVVTIPAGHAKFELAARDADVDEFLATLTIAIEEVTERMPYNHLYFTRGYDIVGHIHTLTALAGTLQAMAPGCRVQAGNEGVHGGEPRPCPGWNPGSSPVENRCFPITPNPPDLLSHPCMFFRSVVDHCTYGRDGGASFPDDWDPGYWETHSYAVGCLVPSDIARYQVLERSAADPSYELRLKLSYRLAGGELKEFVRTMNPNDPVSVGPFSVTLEGYIPSLESRPALPRYVGILTRADGSQRVDALREARVSGANTPTPGLIGDLQCRTADLDHRDCIWDLAAATPVLHRGLIDALNFPVSALSLAKLDGHVDYELASRFPVFSVDERVLVSGRRSQTTPYAILMTVKTDPDNPIAFTRVDPGAVCPALLPNSAALLSNLSWTGHFASDLPCVLRIPVYSSCVAGEVFVESTEPSVTLFTRSIYLREHGSAPAYHQIEAHCSKQDLAPSFIKVRGSGDPLTLQVLPSSLSESVGYSNGSTQTTGGTIEVTSAEYEVDGGGSGFFSFFDVFRSPGNFVKGLFSAIGGVAGLAGKLLGGDLTGFFGDFLSTAILVATYLAIGYLAYKVVGMARSRYQHLRLKRLAYTPMWGSPQSTHSPEAVYKPINTAHSRENARPW